MQGISRLVPRWLAVLLVAAWGLILACAVGGPSGTSQSSSAPEVSAEPSLYETFWIDTYPEKPTDKWKAYMFTNDNVGINVDGLSAFKLVLEIFEFRADKSNVKFHFPHDTRRATCAYTIEKLKKPTRHFDVSLTITSDPQNGGTTKTYYNGPDFRSVSTMPSWVRDSLESSGASKYLEGMDQNPTE